MKSKWLVLFIVFGLILTACGGGSDDAAEEEVVAEEPAELWTHLRQLPQQLNQKLTPQAFVLY